MSTAFAPRLTSSSPGKPRGCLDYLFGAWKQQAEAAAVAPPMILLPMSTGTGEHHNKLVSSQTGKGGDHVAVTLERLARLEQVSKMICGDERAGQGAARHRGRTEAGGLPAPPCRRRRRRKCQLQLLPHGRDPSASLPDGGSAQVRLPRLLRSASRSRSQIETEDRSCSGKHKFADGSSVTGSEISTGSSSSTYNCTLSWRCSTRLPRGSKLRCQQYTSCGLSRGVRSCSCFRRRSHRGTRNRHSHSLSSPGSSSF